MFNVAGEWNNVAIATVKYLFLNLCIMRFFLKSVKENNLKKQITKE